MSRLIVVAGLVLAAGLAHAQQPAPGQPAGSPPTGLVVGSGNFFSPIVANLDKAVAFYRDGIGLEVQGEPGNADANPQLRAMFGMPNAKLRWQIARAPSVQGGVEIVEVSSAGGKQRAANIQDPGTVMLMVVVRDVDATFERLTKLGAPVVTTGGKPVDAAGVRAVVVKDPAGHFVELVQLPRAPPTLVPQDVIAVVVRHTVENLERALALYRDDLGLRGPPNVPGYASLPEILDLLGQPHDVQYRFSRVIVPTSGLGIELMEFKGAHRPAEPARLADPGATRMQLRVKDIDATVAALTKAGGTFVSTGGKPLDLPAGNSTLKVGIVRDPDGLFLVLIEAPPAQ